MTAPAPTRPVLRYLGGKWKLAPWIVAQMPAHRIYVEPFGGAASVLMRKPRAYAEVYNDLSDDVVTVFRVLRDPETAEQLRRALELTPFSRTEFEASYEPATDAVERVRRIVLRSFAGFGSGATCAIKPEGMRTRAGQWAPLTGFRANSNRSGTTPAADWANWPSQVPAFVARLRGVVIERRPAIDVSTQHDGPSTLHYVDPPYVHETRNIANTSGRYEYEMSEADHAALLDCLLGLQGMVLLSGYAHPLYARLTEAGWTQRTRAALADGARKRTEVLWFNPSAAAAQPHAELNLDHASRDA